MFRSSLNIPVAALYTCYRIACCNVINGLHIIVDSSDDGMNKQTETGVSKAVLWQVSDEVMPNERFFPDYLLPEMKPFY